MKNKNPKNLFLAISFLAGTVAHADTNQIGTADGSFEAGLTGAVTTGNASLVSNIGALRPTDGVQAVLLTTEPDSGVAPTDATVSTLSIASFQIDAAYGTLRLDYNFLTDEPTPSRTNDRFTVTLIASTGGEEQVLKSDTFGEFFPAPWTGYANQSGFKTMAADVSAFAGTGFAVTLELRVEDIGDGRRNSAILVDDIRLVEPGAPTARSNIAYAEIDAGDALIFDGTASYDDGSIVEYLWNFGNGYGGAGPLINMDQYTVPGIYQGSLVVVDDQGLSDEVAFTIVVGSINRPPVIVSAPVRFAAEDVQYRYQVVAEDPEETFGDTLTYSLSAAPAGMSIDSSTGLITWLPPVGSPRSNDVTVVATDSLGATGTQSFTITLGPDVYVATMSDAGLLYTAQSNGDGTFSGFSFVEDISSNNGSRGVAIADFDGDGDFDLITGYPSGSAISLWYYPRQNGTFGTPASLGLVSASTGSYLMDMAAEDFDNDGLPEILFSPSSSQVFAGDNSGDFTTTPETFFASDFETGVDTWGGQQCATGLERDNSTSASGSWSMRVFATANSCLSVDINPSDWYLSRGSTVRFEYRIPPGVPAGLLFNVAGRDWIQLGGAPAATPGPFAVSPLAVNLIDDGNWHTVEFDLYAAIRAVWPDASRVTEFEWWTNNDAVAGQEFWFDDFRITRPKLEAAFDFRQLPDTGGDGRGLDAGDVNNDGNQDFVRARTSSGFVYLYTGDGDGNFTTSQVADPGNDPYGAIVADFDNDGNADIIANNNGSGDPYLFRGNGNGTFQAGVYVGSLDTNNYTSLAVFDFDNDGNQDVIASTYSGRQLLAFAGNGDGTFGAATLLGTSTGQNILAAAAPAGRVLGQPFALGTPDADLVNEGESVQFDGTESYDDGNIVAYGWDFGDGATGTGPIVDHIFENEGIYTVVLTVTDDEGYTDRRAITIVVRGSPPTADAGGPYAAGEDVASFGRWAVELDGTGSFDPETSISRYEWDFDASDGVGVDAAEATPAAVYIAPGTYTVTLTVYDIVDQPSTTTTTVTVTAGAAPVSSIGGPAVLDESAASLGKWSGKFELSGAADAEGIARYTIDWGDGSAPESVAGVKDNFDDAELATNPAWTSGGGGSWSAVDGVLQQNNLGSAWRWLQDLNTVYSDFELEVDVRGLGATNGYIGIVFRNTANSSTSTNSFLMYSRDSWNFWRFYDWSQSQVLADGGSGWDPDLWYHLRLRVIGNRLQLFVTPEGGSESLAVEANNPSHPTGSIGLLAYNQVVQYDNLIVRPVEDALRPTHSFAAAGSYSAELTIEDHAGQTDSAAIPIDVVTDGAPLADTGGPYVLDEGLARGSRWTFLFDGTGSIDGTNVERYSIDFGDGTGYTSGSADSRRAGYFLTGTDLYGFDAGDGYLRRIVGTQNGTTVEIINLATGSVIDTRNLNRGSVWSDFNPGNGTYFKVKATKPVNAYLTDLEGHMAFIPSLDGSPVGHEFLAYFDGNSGVYMYAIEDTFVRVYSTAGNQVEVISVPAGEYRRLRSVEGQTRHVVATGRIAIQTTGGNGYSTVPSANGSPVGDLFYFATQPGTTGAFGVFAYAAADIEVFDMNTGASLYTRTMAAGESWFQTGLGTQRLRLVSTGDVEVWAGGTEGGSTFEDLGDDISMTTGRDGTEFVLHNLRDGIVIFAPNDDTDVSIDAGALTQTLQRDEYLHLAPSDFPAGSGVHRIASTQPIVIQTLGRANTLNDLGTYLGGATARHEYTAVGVYDLTLVVTDNGGNTHTATTTVEVTQGDPPIAVIDAPAVADETFAVGGQWFVDFDASGSTDDFGIYSYEWDFGDGTTATGVDPQHAYSEPGTYTVTLTVTDNAGQQTVTTFTIEVTFGDAPVSDAGGPYTFGEEAASYGVWTALLDGTGSTDDSGIFDYEWIFENAFTESFDAPLDSGIWEADSASATAGGVLASTGTGAWGPVGHYSADSYLRPGRNDRRTLSFFGQVRAPAGQNGNAMWGAYQAVPPDFSYTRMRHAIYFNNGTLRIYEDGSQRGTVGSYTKGTLYDVRIDILASGADYFIREAGAVDWTPLTSYASYNRSAGVLRFGASVNLGTFEFDNYRVSESVNGSIIEREFRAPGTTEVTLVVRDNALQSGSDTTTITIEDGDAPTADAGGPYTAEVGSYIAFNGTASSDDTGIQTYDWVFGDMTAGPTAEGSKTASLPFTGSGPTPRHFYQQEGTYTITMTVTDNTGKSATSTAVVDVVTGEGPEAIVGTPSMGGQGGPPVYFDATDSKDDFGIVEYRWDFDDSEDRDGDGDPTNDIEAVGPRPYHVYGAATAPASILIEDTFEGTAVDSTRWTSSGAVVANGALNLTGAGSWSNRYFFSTANFDRSPRIRLTGIVQQDSTGTQQMMWGIKNSGTSAYFTAFRHAIYFNNGTLQIYEAGSNRGTVGSYTNGQAYETKIELGVTGADYFIRESGATEWTALTAYSSLNATVSPLKAGATVANGTASFAEIQVENLGPYIATLTVEDGAGQTSTAQVAVPVAANLAPDVVTVPWVAFDPLVPHETYNGKSIRLKGIVRDADPVTYQWDFGDGTSSGPIAVSNPYDLSVEHTYPDAPAGTPFSAILTVTDSAGNVGSDVYRVVVRPLNLTTEINVAIDAGLWYLHQTQTRSSAQGFDTGYWTSNARASATASAIQAFQVNGHLESVDHSEDPYAETVMRGLRQLFRDLGTVNIGTQLYGEPDTNGNGIGIQTGVNSSGGQPIYQGGQVMDAIASSGGALTRTVTGSSGIFRRSYFDILTDMVDQFSWGQTEQGSGGAWRYAWNNSIDNSAAQWGAIGILAAEDIFGIPVPQWVKERNVVWLERSHNGSGWTYVTGATPSRAGTPSGLVQVVFDDIETDDTYWATGEEWIARNWNSQYIINEGNRPYYPYYALTKAMRLARPEPVVDFEFTGLDWFRDPEKGLARTLIDDQQSNGQFPGSEWITGQLRSAWGVIILSRTLFVQPPVADAGKDRVWGVDIPLEFDASGSFHLDPFRSIVKYEWDFDGDGSFDLSTDEPVISYTYTAQEYPEDSLPEVIDVTLRVTDNNSPALTDIDTVTITVAVPPHPPVADVGGPYTCTAGLPCVLDGTGSFDIDPTDFITSYEWDLDGFPFEFDGAAGPNPEPVFPNPGVYDIGLRVFDNGVLNVNDEPLSDEDFGSVNVEENEAPNADADGPYAVDEGSIVTLDGTASTDPNGDPLTFTWDFDDDGEFDDALGPQPNFLGVDDGLYPVALRVTDGLLDSTATSTVTVRNVAPTVTLGDGATIDEGETFNGIGTFSDPGIEDTWTGTVDYGDGSGPQALALNADKSFNLSHTYGDNGEFTITVTVSDDDGGSNSSSLIVTVNNVAPVVKAGADQTVEAESSMIGSGSFTDPGFLDTHTATVDYGDGSGVQELPLTGSTFSLDHNYAATGNYTVTVVVTDDDNGAGSDSLLITVEVTNQPPVADAGGPYTVNEGASVSLSGAASSDPDGDALAYAWDLDNDGVFETAGENVDIDANGLDDLVQTVSLQVTDPFGLVDEDSTTVTVRNVAPAVDAGPDAALDEGGTFTGAGSFTDPGVLDTHTATVDYGDGSGVQVLPLVGTAFDLSHTYADDGVYTVTVMVTDDDLGVGSDTLTVTVNNVAPVVDAGDNETINEGGTLSRDGSFTDPGADTWVGEVDYGDGTSGPLALNPDKTFSLDHMYTNESDFTVTVTVTDDEGAVGTDSFIVTVLNLAPTVTVDAPDVTVDEGDIAENTGTFDDVGDDIVEVTADVGTVTQVGTKSGTWAWSFDTTDGPDDSQTVTITATDDMGASSQVTFELVVVNVAPTVAADNRPVVVNEGEVAGNTGTFSDPGADTVAITASVGTIVGVDAATGRWTWAFTTTDGPDDSALVLITATDSDGASSTTSFDLVVNNLPPVANDDSYSTTEDIAFFDVAAPGVLTNDTDVPADSLAAVLDTGPSNGTLTLTADGSFRYTPNANFNGTDGFTYLAGDGDGGTDSADVTIEVQPVNDPPSVSASPVPYTVQYSDPVALTISGDDIDSTALSISASGLPAGLSIGTPVCASGAPPVDCDWPIDGTVQAGPGTYTVSVTVTDNGELTDTTPLSATTTFDIVVVQEDARSTYTGPLFLGTDEEGNFSVYLRATIQDISLATDDPANDAYPGDIRNATVRFVDDTGAELCAAPAVDLIFAGNEQLGSAECVYSGTFGKTEDERPIEVTVVVDNYYVDTSDNEVVVLVVRPGEGKITGGGQIEMDNSAGVYAADPDMRTNYGFNAQAQEKGKNNLQLKGRLTIILRAADGRKYKIKSNAILSLGVDLDPDGDGNADTEPHYAEFESKANLVDVTDPLNPISISGNLILQLRMTDNGEPGENDTISFTLWDGGELLFSSNWDGTQSVEQNVARGNLQVH
jgi:PKD repeat protein